MTCVPDVQYAGDIWGRQWTDELPRGQNLLVDGEPRFEKTFLLPPVILASFDGRRGVSLEVRVVVVKGIQRLLLPFGGAAIDERYG